MKEFYLDYNSTTPIHPKIKELIPEWLELYGNPSSIHSIGKKASNALEKSRLDILSTLNIPTYKLVFTSSGTEANHLAFQFLKNNNPNLKKKIFTSTAMRLKSLEK